MCFRLWPCCGVPIVWCTLFAVPGAFGQQAVLRLTGVPDSLVLPLPEGSNRVLTATVAGGQPTVVWLARDKDAKARILLSKVAAGEYQVNLADPEVAALLLSGGGRRQFCVFAEMEDGQVLTSISVSYALSPRVPPPSPLAPGRWPPLRLLAYIHGDQETGRACGPGEHWFNPAKLLKLECPAMVDDDPFFPASVRARAGRQSWQFDYDRQAEVLRLNITAEIRKAWQERGDLHIECLSGQRWVAAAVLKARPGKLDFPGSFATLDIGQRCTAEVPGSHGYLRIELADITGGQVLLTLRTADRRQLIHKASVGQGESIPFELDEEQYVVYVRKLVNLLVGDDWAMIDVARVPAAEMRAIDRLLDHVASAQLTFIREGKEYTGSEAAIHLRQKLTQAGARVQTVEEFIERIASRSSLSGKPYLVKLPDGSTVPAKQWLLQQAAALAQEDREEPSREEGE